MATTEVLEVQWSLAANSGNRAQNQPIGDLDKVTSPFAVSLV